jgi:hypothetical protein
MTKLPQATLFSISFLLYGANALAFAPARLQSPPPLTPREFASFTPINHQGALALKAIQSQQWQRSKVITLQMNLVDSIQVTARQTAKFSLTGDVLKIQSSAADGSRSLDDLAEGGDASPNVLSDYASQIFNAPIVYSSQKTQKDGTVQLVFGVRYLHDGTASKNQSKIGIAAFKNEIFSLPDAMPFDESPNLSQAVQLQLVQFIVLSWNPVAPKSLHLEGIADPSGAESFSTTYSAL